MKTQKALQRMGDVANSFATSRWLSKALTECASRDIADALSDAEYLVALLQARFDELTADQR